MREIEPASREGREPIAVGDLRREDMPGLCMSCIYASDDCNDFYKEYRELDGIVVCYGYFGLLRGD